MQQTGVSDQGIADAFIQEYGAKIYRADPNALGWLVPYSTLVLGVLVIVWFVRRYSHGTPVPANSGAAPPDEALGKYREQIERDMAHLE